MINYKQHTNLSSDYITKKLKEFYKEDLPNGDITTISTINPNSYVKSEIYAVEKLFFSGKIILPFCFNKKFDIKININDGDSVDEGGLIGSIYGPTQEILSKERVMLNLIQRLCGISTLTKKYSSIAEPYKIKILDTRKTTPGIRLFEKYAVAIGGAYNHRLNLSDGILIKDNHITAAGSITNVINNIKKHPSNLPIELEVDNINQIIEAIPLGINGFLLDNMDINKIYDAVSLIRKSNNGNNIFIEASGGINLNNINPYLKSGVNAISIGSLTHQAVSKDIRLEFI